MEAFASPSDDPDILKAKLLELDDQLDTIGLEKTGLLQKGGRLETGPEKDQIDQKLVALQKQEQGRCQTNAPSSLFGVDWYNGATIMPH